MSLVRTLYLYLFSFIGLLIAIIGLIGLFDMGLKAFIFTQADKDMYSQPSCYPTAYDKLSQAQPAEQGDKVCLTEGEKESIDQWVASYKAWQEENSKIDWTTVRRQQEAARDLAMIFIGLPLYVFHWRIIRKELKNKTA